MAVCDWNMCFTFVLAGWESTPHDARVFYQALTNANLNFPHPPPGKYYLVDSGYPTPIGYIGPYRHERYHLPEFRRSNGFANHNEVFNYYHSSLRCTIERTFGVWKNRFAILRRMPNFKFETQVQIVVATMVIHNFIRRKAEIDIDFNVYEDESTIIHHDDSSSNLDQSHVLNVVSSSEMDRVRNIIRNEIIEHSKKIVFSKDVKFDETKWWNWKDKTSNNFESHFYLSDSETEDAGTEEQEEVVGDTDEGGAGVVNRPTRNTQPPVRLRDFLIKQSHMKVKLCNQQCLLKLNQYLLRKLLNKITGRKQ
ncbi:uncharacterized protein [Medicago truncatula]|uniref:uncharacterized protein n=1 Tax=Medicago truncatula TaxID=3880 RepID=UPI001966D4DB|nr:uncharacterized protein LOC120580001 [Medicago truncatula]